MRDHGVDCERQRPSTLVISQQELYPWARGIVWDFRQSPLRCAEPLNYSAPLKPTLNAAFFARELADYPNQRILGMIEKGVIYQADVELQSSLCPPSSLFAQRVQGRSQRVATPWVGRLV